MYQGILNFKSTIHNNASSSEKVLSHQNPTIYLFKTVWDYFHLNCFSLEKAILWIEVSI